MSKPTCENRFSLWWSLAAAGLAGLAGAAAVGFVVDPSPPQPAGTIPPEVTSLPPPQEADAEPLGAETPLEPPTLRRRIELAVDYMVRFCGPDGRFVYWVHLDPRIQPPPDYNVLRHGGTMYALGMFYDENPDPRVRDALVRASAFLRRECVAPLPGRDDLLAVWSPPELVRQTGPPEAVLGGAGLGLVGLLAAERAAPGTIPRDELRKLGRFVLYLQKEDGSFYTKFIPMAGGRWDEWSSLYYPGEAALGLLMLYQHDGEPEWLAAATRALEYLAAVREGADDAPADHWALVATARLLRVADPAPVAIDRPALLRHARQICRQMLAEQEEAESLPVPASQLSGSFTADGRTTPSATRLEGLFSALEFLPDEDPALAARIEEAVERGIAFLLRAQVTGGPYAGGIPRAIGPLPADYPLAGREEFNLRAGEIRIDYVQHAASAMMQYDRLLQGK